MNEPVNISERILILTPTGDDAAHALDVLRQAEISGVICQDSPDLERKFAEGAGALLIAEEAVTPDTVGGLLQTLAAQPPSSDVPLLLITSAAETEEAGQRLLNTFAPHGNITLIERPLRPISLVSALRAALRTRRRQYQLGDILEELRRAEADLRKAHAELNDRAKHLDSLVQQRTAKLQAAIGELEAFSYSVAHDVRAPLRAMSAYAAELLKESGVSPQGQTYAQRIARAAARLDRLTQEVLTYSKLSREEIKVAPVDLDKLAHEVVEQYPEIAAQSESVDIRSPLLPVVGHESLLTQVLSNLLLNAYKFVAPGERSKVLLRTEGNGEYVRIWVEDNGIGIEPRHRERLFKLFGRIHPDDKYEGTGVGLAIVKKAAERMGGSVGFESEPGKGSRFWVELRAAK